MVRLQREEGLDRADWRGGGWRDDASHAVVVIVALVFRRRFQFSIRSLLVLVVAVALPCSWLPAEMKEANRQREEMTRQEKAVSTLEKLSGRSFFHPGKQIESDVDWQTQSFGPEWFQRLVGSKGIAYVRLMNLGYTQIKDADLEHLKTMSQLTTLHLYHTNVTDSGLEGVKTLTQLQYLDVSDTRVTDRGLEHLKGLNELQELRLNRTQVTDAGLETLKGLDKLNDLWLQDTQVTDEGVRKLHKALPKCHVQR